MTQAGGSSDLDQHMENVRAMMHEGASAERQAGDVPEAERSMGTARAAGDRLRDVGRSIGDPGDLAAQVRRDPLVALLVAGAIGYALGWLVHGSAHSRQPESIPDYARKR